MPLFAEFSGTDILKKKHLECRHYQSAMPKRKPRAKSYLLGARARTVHGVVVNTMDALAATAYKRDPRPHHGVAHFLEPDPPLPSVDLPLSTSGGQSSHR